MDSNFRSGKEATRGMSWRAVRANIIYWGQAVCSGAARNDSSFILGGVYLLI